jgi:hypothetical protein
MSPAKSKGRPPTADESRDGYQLNGKVMVVGVFGTMIPLLIALIIGVKPLPAVLCAIVIGGVLAFNVRRVLERQFREKYPDYK